MQHLLWQDVMLISVCDLTFTGSSRILMLVWSLLVKHQRTHRLSQKRREAIYVETESLDEGPVAASSD